MTPPSDRIPQWSTGYWDLGLLMHTCPLREFPPCNVFGVYNTTIITMATHKRPRRAMTLAEAEAHIGGYAVARSTKRLKAGQPFELIRVAPRQGSTSFRPRDMAQALHTGLPEDPMDIGGLFQENMTNFGPEDAPRKRRRAPGLVRTQRFEAYRVVHVRNSRRRN